MQSIGVLGAGVLGKAVARGFMEWGEVKVYDLLPERRTHPLAEAAACGIVFICLPTPAREDGRCETAAVEAMLQVCEEDGYWRPESCYCLRSTVPVGFTQAEAAKRDFRLPLLHSPEFLTARCALTDFQTPARNIVGVPHWKTAGENPDPIKTARWASAAIDLYQLYKRRFPGVPVLKMNSDASELVKLGCNAFFAMKVTAFNLIYELAKSRGVDWEDVRGGILSDGRIAHAHTQIIAPGGYGQACLPKDLADLFWCCLDNGVDAELLRAVHERNVRTRGDDPGLANIELPLSAPPMTDDEAAEFEKTALPFDREDGSVKDAWAGYLKQIADGDFFAGLKRYVASAAWQRAMEKQGPRPRT